MQLLCFRCEGPLDWYEAREVGSGQGSLLLVRDGLLRLGPLTRTEGDEAPRWAALCRGCALAIVGPGGADAAAQVRDAEAFRGEAVGLRPRN